MPFEYSSVNTDDFTYIFEQNRMGIENVAGLIYKITGDAIISASSRDLFSTPFVDGKNPFVHEVYHHSNVLRLYQKDGYEMYGLGTRICTPKSAIKGSNVKQVREVLLDKSKIEPVGVFYMSQQVPERARELQKEYNFKNPPVRISPKNKFKYYDLRELYDCEY